MGSFVRNTATPGEIKSRGRGAETISAWQGTTPANEIIGARSSDRPGEGSLRLAALCIGGFRSRVSIPHRKRIHERLELRVFLSVNMAEATVFDFVLTPAPILVRGKTHVSFRGVPLRPRDWFDSAVPVNTNRFTVGPDSFLAKAGRIDHSRRVGSARIKVGRKRKVSWRLRRRLREDGQRVHFGRWDRHHDDRSAEKAPPSKAGPVVGDLEAFATLAGYFNRH